MPRLPRLSPIATSCSCLPPPLLLAALLRELLLLARSALGLHAASEADLLGARGLLLRAPHIVCGVALEPLQPLLLLEPGLLLAPLSVGASGQCRRAAMVITTRKDSCRCDRVTTKSGVCR